MWEINRELRHFPLEISCHKSCSRVPKLQLVCKSNRSFDKPITPHSHWNVRFPLSYTWRSYFPPPSTCLTIGTTINRTLNRKHFHWKLRQLTEWKSRQKIPRKHLVSKLIREKIKNGVLMQRCLKEAFFPAAVNIPVSGVEATDVNAKRINHSPT